jgi:hypothetical protein
MRQAGIGKGVFFDYELLGNSPFGAGFFEVEVTSADVTARSTSKIKDPSRGPGMVDFTDPQEAFGLEGTPKIKIQRDLSPQKGNLICGMPLYSKNPAEQRPVGPLHGGS